MSSFGKIGLAFLFFLALLVLLFPLITNNLVDKNKILQSAEMELERLTDLEVKINQVHLFFLPSPRVHFSKVVFLTSSGDPERPVISIPTVTASLKILPLLTGKSVVKRVDLDNPTLSLYREEDGKWNYSDLTSLLKSQNRDIGDLPTNLAAGIREVRIGSGRLELEDSEMSFLNPDLIFEQIDAVLRYRSQDSPVEVAASLSPKRNGEAIMVRGKIGPLNMEHPLKTWMNLSLKGERIQLAEYQTLLNQFPLEISGWIATDGTFEGTLAEGVKFVQQATYEGIRISTENGFVLLDNLSAELDQAGIIHPATRTITLEKFGLKNNGFKVNASGSVHHKGIVPVMDLDLPTGWIDLKAASAFVPLFGQAFNAEGHFDFSGELKGTTGRDLTADLRFQSPRVVMSRGLYLLKTSDSGQEQEDKTWVEPDFHLPDLPLSIRAAASVEEGQFEWVKFNDLEAHASLKDYWISLDEMTFDAFDGSVRGSAWLNLTETPPAYGNDVTIRNIELDKFLTDFAGLKGIMSGKASTKLYVSGRGRSMAQFKNTTSGVGQIRISSGSYSPADFLSSALKTASLSSAGDGNSETRFDRMNAYIVIKDGKIDFRELRCRGDDWSLEGMGVIRLDQTMSLDYVMTLSDSLTKAMKPEDIARLKRSSDGRVQLPFTLSGTFTQPNFSIKKEITQDLSTRQVRNSARMIARDRY
jgi:uncharacterized protein involved in outer membrane biogenesis